MTQDEIRAAMAKKVAAEIDALVEWGAKTEGVTLTEIEDRVLAARQRIGQELTQGLMEQQEGRRNAEIPVNEGSQKRQHPKGVKRGR